MSPEDIAHMKAVPGIHRVRMEGGGPVLIVASIGGKIYGLIPDNELNDEGWHKDAVWSGCLAEGDLMQAGPTLRGENGAENRGSERQGS